MILQYGCNSNQIDDDVHGKSVFHYVIDFDSDDEILSKGEYDIIKFFLEHGTDPNLTTRNGMHPQLQMLRNSLKLTMLLKHHSIVKCNKNNSNL